MDYLYLIKQAKKGDAHAFTELYKTVYRKLYQYALYTLGNPQDAEDAVSDTVLDAFDGIKKLKKDEAFDGWIFRILQAKCNRKLRQIIANRNIIDFDSYAEATGNDPTAESAEALSSDPYWNEAQQLVLRMDLQNALSTLDPLDREIIGMHVLLGYKFHEIAAALNLNENTVRSRESRALKKMRTQVKEVM